MKLTPLTLFVLFTAATHLGSVPAGQSRAPIINGDAYDSDQHPSAGQLILSGSLQGREVAAPVCTAVLVAPDVVLTAAHCLGDLPITLGLFELDDMQFHLSFEEDLTWMNDQAGGGDADLPGDALSGSGFVLHEDFELESLQADGTLLQQYDIGLVFLPEPVDHEHAWVVTADEAEQVEEGMELEIVGYGQRTPERQGFPADPDASALRYGGISFINRLAEYEFQVGDGPETTRKCHGDSGGPSYAEIGGEDAPWRVIGVTSRAYRAETDCEEGGVDTNVIGYLDWIDEQLRKACDDGLRADTMCDEPGLPTPVRALEEDDDESGDGCAQSDCSVARKTAPTSMWWIPLVAGATWRRRR